MRAAIVAWERPIARASRLQSELAAIDWSAAPWPRRLNDFRSRVTELEAADTARQQWIDANAPRLHRRAQLTAAIARRQTDLVTAATLRTPAWVIDAIGPYPEARAERRAWRHAARELLSNQDRRRGDDRGVNTPVRSAVLTEDRSRDLGL